MGLVAFIYHNHNNLVSINRVGVSQKKIKINRVGK